MNYTQILIWILVIGYSASFLLFLIFLIIDIIRNSFKYSSVITIIIMFIPLLNTIMVIKGIRKLINN
jgi:hypothetical protein